MTGLAICIALLLDLAPVLPRPVWVGVVMGVTAIKSQLILLDYLELRCAPAWRNGAVGSLFLLVAALSLLSVL